MVDAAPSASPPPTVPPDYDASAGGGPPLAGYDLVLMYWANRSLSEPWFTLSAVAYSILILVTFLGNRDDRRPCEREQVLNLAKELSMLSCFSNQGSHEIRFAGTEYKFGNNVPSLLKTRQLACLPGTANSFA